MNRWDKMGKDLDKVNKMTGWFVVLLIFGVGLVVGYYNGKSDETVKLKAPGICFTVPKAMRGERLCVGLEADVPNGVELREVEPHDRGHDYDL